MKTPHKQQLYIWGITSHLFVSRQRLQFLGPHGRLLQLLRHVAVARRMRCVRRVAVAVGGVPRDVQLVVGAPERVGADDGDLLLFGALVEDHHFLLAELAVLELVAILHIYIFGCIENIY